MCYTVLVLRTIVLLLDMLDFMCTLKQLVSHSDKRRRSLDCLRWHPELNQVTSDLESGLYRRARGLVIHRTVTNWTWTTGFWYTLLRIIYRWGQSMRFRGRSDNGLKSDSALVSSFRCQFSISVWNVGFVRCNYHIWDVKFNSAESSSRIAVLNRHTESPHRIAVQSPSLTSPNTDGQRAANARTW